MFSKPDLKLFRQKSCLNSGRSVWLSIWEVAAVTMSGYFSFHRLRESFVVLTMSNEIFVRSKQTFTSLKAPIPVPFRNPSRYPVLKPSLYVFHSCPVGLAFALWPKAVVSNRNHIQHFIHVGSTRILPL